MEIYLYTCSKAVTLTLKAELKLHHHVHYQLASCLTALQMHVPYPDVFCQHLHIVENAFLLSPGVSEFRFPVWG